MKFQKSIRKNNLDNFRKNKNENNVKFMDFILKNENVRLTLFKIIITIYNRRNVV